MTAIDTATIEQIPVLSLEVQRDMLAVRLATGFEKIEKAESAGEDVGRWEQVWLKLLKEYEEICDQIASRPLAGSR